MPKSMWDESARQELIERLDRLTPDAKPLWGKFNASQMVAHLGSAMRMASGELPTTPKNLPIRFTPFKQIIAYWAPSLGQLKILQEAITLLVFVPFAILYMKQQPRLDFLWAGRCIIAAVYFVFRGQGVPA